MQLLTFEWPRLWVGLGLILASVSTCDPINMVTESPDAPASNEDTVRSEQRRSSTNSLRAHARFAAIDYRIHYVKEPQRTREYDQSAARYDVAIGGKVDAWKARNPSVRQYVYDLIVGERHQDSGPMEAWLKANGFPVEAAYLHRSGTSKTRASRVSYHQWTDDYWALNPGDPGQIAWREHVTKQLTASTAAGHRFDGLFFDVLGDGGTAVIPATTLEYGEKGPYHADLNALLGMHASWSPGGRCMANTGNYLTDLAAAQATACRGVVMEFANDVYSEVAFRMWRFISERIADGTEVVLTPQRQGYLKNTPRYNMAAGNYGSVAERVLLAEYANYLMVLEAAHMDLLSVDFHLTGDANPAHPHAMSWLPAFEVDLGPPVSARSILVSGTDGAAQPYDVFVREFTNGLVVYRPLQNWARTDFSDATAEEISLPAEGTWRILLPNGSLGSHVASVRLRNGEAAILIK